MLQDLFPLLLKVLGCAVGIYILAGFLVSLKRLLPFLAVASSFATLHIVYVVRTGGDESLFWLPLVLSLLTQLLYQGEGYMNPRIHENLYYLVSVERKWNSLFADFDDYELHFAPWETGGFVENTIIYGIAYGLYYHFLLFGEQTNWAVYILPLFIAVMSVVDLLVMVNVLRISPLFYGFLRVLLCILTIAVGLLGPFGQENQMDAKRRMLYEQAKDISTVDFDTTSYMAWYEWVYYSGQSKYTQEEYNYAYDATLDIGGEFYDTSTLRTYETVYTKLREYGEGYVVMKNRSTSDYEWTYYGSALERDGPLKFSSLETPDFASYITFTKNKVANAFQLHNRVEDNYYVIQYESEYDSTYDKENGLRYRVFYTYSTDDDGNLLALTRIECEVHTDENNMHSLILHIGTREHGMEALYTDESLTSLKGYTYNPDIQFGLNLSDIFANYNGTNASIADYDFVVRESKDGQNILYVYDLSSNITAIYQESYDLGISETNDFASRPYHPDYYVSGDTLAIYDSECSILASYDRPQYFVPWTFNHQTTYDFIDMIFTTDFGGDITIHDEGGSWIVVTMTQRNRYYDGDTVTYSFHISRINNQYDFQYLEATATYRGAEYFIRVRSNDDYKIEADLPTPT